MFWITPSLAIDADGERDAVAASRRIVSGRDVMPLTDEYVAVVADEETARDVLGLLGLTEAEIEDRFRFARSR